MPPVPRHLLPAVLLLLALAAAGCGSDDPAPAEAPGASAAAPAPEPGHAEPEAEARHAFAPGHSRAVREYYGTPHVHAADTAGDTEAEYHVPPEPATGRLGDTITLTGSNLGIRMRVRVSRVAPVRAAGRRHLAVTVRLVNTGIAVYENTLAEAVVVTASGRRARAVTGVRAPCSNGLDDHLRLDVGERATGCVLFPLAAGQRPRRLHLALEQVPALAGGRWSLR